jgi:hypothetical protein
VAGRAVKGAFLALLLFLAPAARADFRDFSALPVDGELERALAGIADQTLAAQPKLTRENLSITLIDLGREGSAARRASFQPEIGYHPASVVKLFFLVGAHERMRTGFLRTGPELERAMRDMIVDSSNDATAYVVDAITDTTAGPELEGRAWRKWSEKRMWVTRWFAARGYGIKAATKTFCEGPYGREKQILGVNRENRNRMTSADAAALVYDIVRGQAVSRAASDQMLALMRRDVAAQRSAEGENQVREFLGEALPDGSLLWSKAGWTSEVRHDAVYVELPGGRRFIAAVLTRGDAADVGLLPSIGRRLVALMETRG